MNPTELVSFTRNAFTSGKTKPLQFREKQLRNLLHIYHKHKQDIIQALTIDLRKPMLESLVMEVDYLINDLTNTLHNLRRWARPEHQPKEFANLLDSLQVHNDPYGVVLVIGSWNYPIQLTLLPVHGAIAAGNCVIIKPSEISSASSKLMARLIPQYLDAECYRVFEGGPTETKTLLEQRFDYIFYTGSTHVGRLIHAAANKHLTPVTLELGGKSPVYLDASADLSVATKRILWGKCVNAGQTCVAPDYLICTPQVRDAFIKEAKNVLKDFFGEDPQKSPDFGRIISANHFKRVLQLLAGLKVEIGGQTDQEDRYIAPTIVNCGLDDPLMKEEIFAPILPIVTVDNVYEAIGLINTREKPLTFYIFASNKTIVRQLIDATSSGGVCVNDTIMQMATEMPFGGVGSSGMGAYHGKLTFDTFSHKKSTLYKDLGWLGETLSLARYPPYSTAKLAYLGVMLKKRHFGNACTKALAKFFIIFGLGYGAALFFNVYQK